MFTEPNNFVKLIKDIVIKEIGKSQTLKVWQVTDIQNKEDDGYITQYKCQIKHLDFKFTLDDVPIAGLGLGHMKGIIKYPAVGDMVLVAFMDKQPIVLGTVFDWFSQNPDSVPLIKEKELMMIQKEKGSIILMKDNNDVKIQITAEDGSFTNMPSFVLYGDGKVELISKEGAKIRLNLDGSFKIFNKTNHGIEVDSSGSMTIRGTSINATQNGGTW